MATPLLLICAVPYPTVPGIRMTFSIRRDIMSDLKSKTEDKIDDVAAAAKTTAAKAIDKTKDLSHSAGKKLRTA